MPELYFYVALFLSLLGLFPPLPGMGGSGNYPGPCTPERQKEVRERFIQVMKQLDSAFGLCNGECDYSSVEIKCGGGDGSRRKRQLSNSIVIEFNIPTNR